MLKIKKLTFSNIGRFVDLQTIDFDQLGNLTKIEGQSGVGKSMVAKAIDYLFGINSIPSSVLQSRFTKESLYVSGEFDWNDKSISISRSKKEGLIIDISGEIYSGSKITEEKLDEIIGISRDLFRSVIHKKQKEGGFFLNLSPKEMHNFLSDCLGFNTLKRKSEILDKKNKELSENRDSTLREFEINKSSHDATKNAISLLEIPIKEIEESTTIRLQEKLFLSKQNFHNKQAILKTELEEFEKNIPKLSAETYDRSKIERLEKQLIDIRDEISEILDAEKERILTAEKRVFNLTNIKTKLESKLEDIQKFKEKLKEINLSLEQIRSNKCPTCLQQWNTDNKINAEQSLINQYKELESKISIEDQEKQNLNDTISAIDEFKKQTSPIEDPRTKDLKTQFLTLKSILTEERDKEKSYQLCRQENHNKLMDIYQSNLKSLRNKQEIELEALRGQVSLDSTVLEVALNKIRSYNESKKKYDYYLGTLTEKEKELGELIKTLSDKLNSLNGELSIVEELRKAIKSYISCSFDEILETISNSATSMIGHIPNMANATIRLEALRETKEGKIKEEVNAVINIDGELNIPIKSLSGGEESSVDLAIDLAVIDLIESKSGVGANFYVLDEPFNGLDTPSIQMAVEMLKSLNFNKKLVIIDHNPEIGQMITNKIIVEKDGKFSKIIQN